MPDQGKQALYVMESALLVLIKLTDGGEHREQHIWALINALMMWTLWHHALPRAASQRSPMRRPCLGWVPACRGMLPL